MSTATHDLHDPLRPDYCPGADLSQVVGEITFGTALRPLRFAPGHRMVSP